MMIGPLISDLTILIITPSCFQGPCEIAGFLCLSKKVRGMKVKKELRWAVDRNETHTTVNVSYEQWVTASTSKVDFDKMSMDIVTSNHQNSKWVCKYQANGGDNINIKSI